MGVLGVDNLNTTWKTPVEEQNHDVPPKKIVEKIFRQFGNKYDSRIDCPRILGSANYQDIAARCPQAFKPFVEFLENM